MEQALAQVTISEADGVRYLHLGTPWVQGAMRMAKPDEIELEYVRRMMAWMLLRPHEQLTEGRAVQFGLGAAAITRYCYRVLGMSTVAVELNAQVIAACRVWFQLAEDDERLKVIFGDAAACAADPVNAATVDVLCVDLYDHEAAGPVLDSAAFYRDCCTILRDGGVMSVNLFGRDASFERSASRIASVFGEARMRALQPTKEGNTVVLALKNADIPDDHTLGDRARRIVERFGLPATKWVKMLRTVPTSNSETSAA